MTEEIALLRTMLDFNVYTKYVPILSKLKGLEAEHKQVLQAIGKYYEKYPEQKKIDPNDLRSFFYLINPAPKDKELTDTLLLKISTMEFANRDLLIDYLNLLAEKEMAAKMMVDCNNLLNGTSGTIVDQLRTYISDYDALTGKVEEEDSRVCKMSVREMVEMKFRDGLDWRLQFLNRHVGKVPAGTLIHVFAYSNTGKSAFALSEMTKWAQQIPDNECIIFGSNEEPVFRSRLRAISATFRLTEEHIMAEMDKADRRFREVFGDKIIFLDEIEDIYIMEHYLNKYKPRAFVIDQGPKVAVPGGDPRHEKLQSVFYQFRKFAKKYNTIIMSLGQGDAKTENKKWLDLSMLDGSKVGVQGELDLAIGIGATSEAGMGNIRYINICKNKLTGIHERGPVLMDYKTVRYEDRKS